MSGIGNEKIILFPVSHYFGDKSLSVVHALAFVEESKVNVIMINFSNKLQSLPAGVTVPLMESVGDDWLKADERAAPEQHD